MMRWVALALALCCAAARADDAPRTMVRARLDPPGPAVPGQTVRLVVDVLVTTFFTDAPKFPPLDVSGAVVTLPDESAAKLTERIEGVDWFGLSRAYLVTPTAGGTLAIPPIDVTMQPGPGGSTVTLSTPALSLVVQEEKRPAGAEHAVGSTHLELVQQLDRSLEGIRAGDAITRTITVSADGVRAMFLPPATFPPVKGLAVYPANPVVEDVTRDRVGFTGGRRVDAATYVVQEAGRYELPALSVQWWDTSASQLRTATVPAITFTAASSPDYRPELALPAEEAAATRGESIVRVAAIAGVLLAVVLAVWLAAPWVRRAEQALARRRAERRARYEASEAWAFERLRDAARGGDAAATYAALGRWIARTKPAHGETIAAFCAAAHDTDLTKQCEALEARLFGDARAGGAWSGTALFEDVARARRKMRPAITDYAVGLEPLNPA